MPQYGIDTNHAEFLRKAAALLRGELTSACDRLATVEAELAVTEGREYDGGEYEWRRFVPVDAEVCES